MHIDSEIRTSVEGSDHSHLMNIAYSAASLSETVPELALLCHEMEEHSQQQAKRAQNVAEMTESLVDEIGKAINELNLSSSRTTSVIDTINNIAEATKILALNATIQAVRVGAAGKGFSAVADNVKKLANDTSDATATVDENLSSIRDNVDRVSGAIGFTSNTLTKDLSLAESDRGLALLNTWIGEISKSAYTQKNNVEAIRQLGDKTRGLAEDLFLSFGKFRLDYHKRVESIIEDLSLEMPFQLTNREQMENRLLDLGRQYPFIQIAYVTDKNGCQITSNIGSSIENESDTSALGANWSSRHWFAQVKQLRSISISDIYRSVSSDQFCFTVSAPVNDLEDEFAAVLALDIDLVTLLEFLKQ